MFELLQPDLHLLGLLLRMHVAARHILTAHFLIVDLFHQLLRRPVEFQQQHYEIQAKTAGENPEYPFVHGDFLKLRGIRPDRGGNAAAAQS